MPSQAHIARDRLAAERKLQPDAKVLLKLSDGTVVGRGKLFQDFESGQFADTLHTYDIADMQAELGSPGQVYIVVRVEHVFNHAKQFPYPFRVRGGEPFERLGEMYPKNNYIWDLTLLDLAGEDGLPSAQPATGVDGGSEVEEVGTGDAPVEKMTVEAVQVSDKGEQEGGATDDGQGEVEDLGMNTSGDVAYLNSVPQNIDGSQYKHVSVRLRIDQIVVPQYATRDVDEEHVGMLTESILKNGFQISQGMMTVTRASVKMDLVRARYPPNLYKDVHLADKTVTVKGERDREDGEYVRAYYLLDGQHRLQALHAAVQSSEHGPFLPAHASVLVILRTRKDGEELSFFEMLAVAVQENMRSQMHKKPSFLDQVRVCVSSLLHIRQDNPGVNVAISDLGVHFHRVGLLSSPSPTVSAQYARLASCLVRRPAIHDQLLHLAAKEDVLRFAHFRSSLFCTAFPEPQQAIVLEAIHRWQVNARQTKKGAFSSPADTAFYEDCVALFDAVRELSTTFGKTVEELLAFHMRRTHDPTNSCTVQSMLVKTMAAFNANGPKHQFLKRRERRQKQFKGKVSSFLSLAVNNSKPQKSDRSEGKEPRKVHDEEEQDEGDQEQDEPEATPDRRQESVARTRQLPHREARDHREHREAREGSVSPSRPYPPARRLPQKNRRRSASSVRPREVVVRRRTETSARAENTEESQGTSIETSPRQPAAWDGEDPATLSAEITRHLQGGERYRITLRSEFVRTFRTRHQDSSYPLQPLFDDKVPSLLPLGCVPSLPPSGAHDFNFKPDTSTSPLFWTGKGCDELSSSVQWLYALGVPKQHRALVMLSAEDLRDNKTYVLRHAGAEVTARREPRNEADRLEKASKSIEFFATQRQKLYAEGYCVFEGFFSDRRVQKGDEHSVYTEEWMDRVVEFYKSKFPSKRERASGHFGDYWEAIKNSEDHAGPDSEGEGRFTTPRRALMELIEQSPSTVALARYRAAAEMRSLQICSQMKLEEQGLMQLGIPCSGCRILTHSEDCEPQVPHLDYPQKEKGNTARSANKVATDQDYSVIWTGCDAMTLLGWPHSHVYANGPLDTSMLVARVLPEQRIVIPPYSCIVFLGDFYHAGPGAKEMDNAQHPTLRFHMYVARKTASRYDNDGVRCGEKVIIPDAIHCTAFYKPLRRKPYTQQEVSAMEDPG